MFRIDLTVQHTVFYRMTVGYLCQVDEMFQKKKKKKESDVMFAVAECCDVGSAHACNRGAY